MPVPHFNIKITQRSKGNSAVAGAAYQAGEKLFSEYDQKTKNYTCKKEVVYTEIMLPPNAPPEYADRATLWNSVEEIVTTLIANTKGEGKAGDDFWVSATRSQAVKSLRTVLVY